MAWVRTEPGGGLRLAVRHWTLRAVTIFSLVTSVGERIIVFAAWRPGFRPGNKRRASTQRVTFTYPDMVE
jgi:hypothetical protein